MARIFYGSLVLSLGLALMSLYGGTEHPNLLEYVAQVIVTLQMGIIALVVPSLTTPAISSEIEAGTFELLRLTPLRAGEIFWGKLVPGFVPALLPVIAFLPAYAAIGTVDPGYVPYIVRLLAVFAAAIVMCCSLGLACSSFTSSSARATIVCYVIVAVIFLAPLCVWLAGSAHLRPKVATAFAVPSPLVIALNILPTEAASATVRDLWKYHVAVIIGSSGIVLGIARLRLALILQRGEASHAV